MASGVLLSRTVGTIGIVGGFDKAHIGGYLSRAAADLGLQTAKFDAADAWCGPRLRRAIRWHFGDRRPLRQEQFSTSVVEACVSRGVDVVIATGAAPLSADALDALKGAGVFAINYSTDDPWNRLSRAEWFLQALPHYDVVATPRRANVDDLRRLGCTDVRYLPFGYDELAHAPTSHVSDVMSHDVLFVGGADRDRAAFVSDFVRSGLAIGLVGSYWDRYRHVRRYWVGSQTPDAIRQLTAAAKVNLCLVRRDNRDGHVMRSLEIAAIGGCILAEDTSEHRELFGQDGDNVVYFTTPVSARERARKLLDDPAERSRLAAAVRRRIAAGAHSYGDRLRTMVGWAAG